MRLDKISHGGKIKDSFVEMLNITFIESDDEMVLDATMPVKSDYTQALGVLHGGATISLAESVAGIGSNAVCAADELSFGMQISASHISSAQVGDTIIAKGVIQHKGRSTHVWNVDVFSTATSKLISTIRITNVIRKK